MKKNLKKMFLLMAVVVTTVVCFAFSAGAVTETGTCGENITWTLDKITGLLVIEGNGDMENFYPGENDFGEPNWGYAGNLSSPKIPYGNFEYYSDSDVYRDCTVKYVVIKDGVTSIGYNAFNFFYSLKAVELPESITDIDERAFGRYNNLTTVYYKGTSENFSRIEIGNNNSSFETAEIVYGCSLDREMIKKEVRRSGTCGDNLTWTYDETGLLKIVGTGAMYAFGIDEYSVYGEVAPWRNIKYLLAVEIGDGVTNIGQCAFYGCIGLKSIKLGKSLTSIDSMAFSGCSNIENIIIPNGVIKIDTFAFDDCSKLKSVTIPESVKTINSGAFEKCSSLETVEIPNSVNELGGYAFYGCKNLSNVIISNNLSIIDVGVFEMCTNLESIIIPNGITSIGDYAFKNCQKMKTITIPDSVTYIGGFAFSSCTSLDEILIPDSVVYLGDTFWNTAYYNDVANWENGALYVGKHLIKVKEDFSGNYEVKLGTKTIAGGACYGCGGLASISIPESLVSIASNAFFCCDNLSNVYFSGSQKQWGSIKIADFNDSLNNATIHYAKGCSHINIDILNAVAATCAKTGLTEGKKCSDCGEIIVVQTVTAKIAHKEVKVNGKAATCTSTGLTEGKKCTICGTATVAQKTVAKKEHSYKNTTAKATLTKNGKVENKCSVCDKISKTSAIYYPKTIKLSKTAYTYNGKVQTPTVTVKDSKGKLLKEGTDYTVKYESGRKATGRYNVKITFKGKYSGTKTLTYTIAPKATSKLTAQQSTSAIKLTWSKVTGADGYRVYKYNTSTKKWESVKTTTATSCKVEKLKSGTTYKFKIKAYKKDDGTIWGKATEIITVATKPATPKITKLTATKSKASLVWSDVDGESGYEVYCSTKKDSGFKKAASTKANAAKTTVSKLTSGRTYYFKVRAYKTVGNTVVYSAWSNTTALKVK